RRTGLTAPRFQRSVGPVEGANLREEALMVPIGSFGFRTVLLTLPLVVAALGAVPVFAADVTTPFVGKAVNGGTVTHETRAGRHVLTVSSDFVVPGSPDPHWQVVNSQGQVFLLDRLKLKDDRINTSITLPGYV